MVKDIDSAPQAAQVAPAALVGKDMVDKGTSRVQAETRPLPHDSAFRRAPDSEPRRAKRVRTGRVRRHKGGVLWWLVANGELCRLAGNEHGRAGLRVLATSGAANFLAGSLSD